MQRWTYFFPQHHCSQYRYTWIHPYILFSTCSFCFYFQRKVSCTRNIIFTITVFLCMMFIKTVPVYDAKMNILFSYITAASTDTPGFTLASFLSTCSFCFHFQWPVSCTRNVFTITQQPLTFSHVLGD